MRLHQFAFPVMLFITLGPIPSPVFSQTTAPTVEKIGLAHVELTEDCESDDDGEQDIIVTSGRVFLPILGGILGNVAGAGLTALATALESASSARAIGAEGRTSFEFYYLDRDELTPVDPTIGTAYQCLTLAVPRSRNNQSGRGTTSNGGQPDEGTLASSYALVVEARLSALRDGFVIQPIYIDYSEPLPGAPKRQELPSELHVALSTPGAVANGVATDPVFALARIPLPRLKPGETWTKNELIGTAALLPYRPHTGATGEFVNKLTPMAPLEKGLQDLAAIDVRLRHLVGLTPDGNCASIICPDYIESGELDDFTDEEIFEWALGPKTKLTKQQQDALRAALAERDKIVLSIEEARARLSRLAGVSRASRDEEGDDADLHDRITSGSTLLKARIVLTRSANRFGLAVASALKNQSAPLSTAVSSAVNKLDDPAWTTELSQFALARLTVQQKEQALARARLGGDPSAIENAELAVLTAKTTLNEKAAAAGQPIPYPDVGN